MSILEFIVYAGNLRWRGNFRDKFTKHFGRRSRSPTRVKTRDKHDSKWPEDRSVNVQVFRDSTRKQRSLHSKDSSLNRETTSKAHMQVHTNKESCKKQPGRKPGPNQAEMVLGQPAWADRSNPLRARFDAPFCPRCLSIYCLCLRRAPHPSIHQRVAETNEKHREEADGRRKSSSCLGDGLGHALAAMVGPAW
jgi:hypothetical protein